MKKDKRHQAIRDRAADALLDLYHNASVTYPMLDESEAKAFQAWFNDIAQCEIEYLQDGGAYGRDYRKTLEAECNAGRFKSEAARRYYIRKGMREMAVERARCNTLDSRNRQLTNAMWEYAASQYGKLYTYGRGGRTLAPDSLIATRGGSSFGIKEDYASEMNMADCVWLIRIVESFNLYVAKWCEGVPEMWKEERKEIDARAAEIIASKRTDLAAVRRQFLATVKEARDACETIRPRVAIRAAIAETLKRLAEKRGAIMEEIEAIKAEPWNA